MEFKGMDKTKYKIKCNCGAILEYDNDDIDFEPYLGLSLLAFETVGKYYIRCPKCYRKIIVDSDL